MTPKYEDYKVLFKLQGRLTCLHAEMFTCGSLGVGHSICLYHGGHWDTYIELEGEKRCNAKGAELLGNPQNYWKWAEKFRAYIEKAKSEIIPHFQNGPIRFNENEVRVYLDSFLQFQDFYGITDFPYSEGMYQQYKKTPSAELQKAMDDFGKLKFEGRAILNAYMHDTGVYPSFLRSISIQGGLDPSVGQFLFSQDILGIVQGIKINTESLRLRSDYYSCGFDGKFHIFDYKESKRLWEEFHPDYIFEGELKGISACKGKAKGRVVIAPMLTDPAAISKVIERMQDGDILVAESTTPEFVPLCKKAAAIVTDQGGMLSHAAVVSRELKKPCIIGTLKATHVLKDGDVVEVDADRAIIRLINKEHE